MERPEKKLRLTEDRDQDTVPTESKQQHIQLKGSALTGKPNMECKSESLAGSRAESDGNQGSSTSKIEPCVNDGSSTLETKAYDNHGYSGSEVSSGDNEDASRSESESLESSGNSSGSLVSSGENDGSSGCENQSSQPSGVFLRGVERWDIIWRASIHNHKDETWLAALSRSERHVFTALLWADFRFPWPIMQIITKMGGGYVNVCDICEEEVHDSQSEPELPCWCETESLPFDCPLPLCDSCHYRKYSRERNEPASYYGFGPWLSCSKCKQPFFNWGVGGDK